MAMSTTIHGNFCTLVDHYIMSKFIIKCLLLSVCDVCGENHETDTCPMLQNGLSVEDTQAPSRSRLTLPSNLRIKKLKDGSVTVVAREKIPSGTRFGPFEARVIYDLAPDSNFVLKIFEKDGSSVYLDAQNENECNWMCLVVPAKKQVEQNLMAYQLRQDIYYSALRDIRIHEELRVWYALPYGVKIGIPPPWPPTSEKISRDSMTSLQVSEPLTKPDQEITTQDQSRMLRKRRRKKKMYEEYVEMQDDLEDETESANIDPKRLGFSEQREWHCSQCGEAYQNCINFAKHLREHYHPRKSGNVPKRKSAAPIRPKNFICQYCAAKFSSIKLLQRHRLRLHRRQMRAAKSASLNTGKHDVTAGNNIEGDEMNQSLIDESNQDASHISLNDSNLDHLQSNISEKDAASILLEFDGTVQKNSIHLNLVEGEQTLMMQPHHMPENGITSKLPQSMPVIIVEGDILVTDIIQSLNADTDHTHSLMQDPSSTEVMSIAAAQMEKEPSIENIMETACAQLMEDPPAAQHGQQEGMDENFTDAFSSIQSTTKDAEYVCDICDRTFEKSIYLFRHIRKHTGEFACDKCQKVFARKESLVKHVCNVGEDESEDDDEEYLCQYCQKSFNSKHLLRRHAAKHTGEFTCTECGKSYCSSDVLKDHVCVKNVNATEVYDCSICHKTFSKLKYLEKHLPVHTGAHTCPICGKWLRSHDSLINHMRICGQVKELETNGHAVCPHCQMEFSDVRMFRRHLYEHTYLFMCKTCGARFRTKVSLTLHHCTGELSKNEQDVSGKLPANHGEPAEKTIVKGTAPIKCKKCGFSSHHKNAFTKHVCKSKSPKSKGRKLTKQPSLQPLICEVCGSLFSSTSSLNVHKRLHGEKQFSCDICGKRFHRKDLLIDHCAVHGEPAVPCPVCGKMFKTKKSLDVHLLIHNGVRRFSCRTCGKQFYQKGNLIKHEEVHNPERKYTCNHCSKSFSTKEYLAIHVLEHTRGRIYVCTICDKSFIKEHQLKAHQRVFHTNFAYICKFCGLSVKLKHSLRRHLTKKHADQSHLWNNGIQIEEMLRPHPEQVNDDSCQDQNHIEDIDLANDISQVQGAEILLAVAGIGSEALQEAIASGTAQIHQGSTPNTIQISLPMSESLRGAIANTALGQGDEMEARIIHLPISSEVENIVQELDDQQLQIAVSSALSEGNETQIAVMDTDDQLQNDPLPEGGTLVLENGTILQQGVPNDVLFYVLTTDNQNCDKPDEI